MPRRRRTEEVDEDEGTPQRETQRRRTSHAEEEDEDFDGGEATQGTGGGLEEMAKKMVRLALACEFQRKPIRRQEISDKVLGTNGRQFKSVFNQAQMHLRDVFGMEMVELPAKEKVTLQQKRAAQRSANQTKSATAASWILTSTLPPEFRHPDIIKPTSPEDSKYTAIYSVLVALIATSGGTLPEAKMERYLRKLGMEDRTPIEEFDKTDKLMKRLEKDGYVIRVKESTGTGEDDIYYIVGPRGKTEIGDNGVRGLVSAVYGDLEEDEEDELERKIARSLGLAEKPPPAEKPKETQKAEKSKKKSGKRRSAAAEESEEEEDEDAEAESEDDE